MALGQPSYINAGTHSIEFWEDVTDIQQLGAQFEMGQSAIPQTIRINWSDQEQAIEDILGTHFVTGTELIRVTPLQHGIFTNMYATKVSIVGGYRASGKFDIGYGNDCAQYLYAVLQIAYNTLPFSIGQNGGFSEYDRYTVTLAVPGAEFVKTPNVQQFLWASSVNPPDGPGNGTQSVQFQQTRLLPKADVSVDWYYVPDGWIFNGGIPSNILNCVGKVNSLDFGNYPAGTLLCAPPTFTPIIMPIYTNAPADPPYRLWNVRFNFKYFNPPQNNEEENGEPGHNTAPWTDGLFYPNVTEKGNNRLYDTENFYTLFNQVGT